MLAHSKAFSSFAVKDIQQAKTFYKDTLKLDVKDNPMGLIELHLNGGTTVLIYPKPDHAAAAFTVLNFPVENLEKTVDKLTEKGIVFEQYPDLKTDKKGISRNEEGPMIAWFKDPCGNILAVMEED